MSAKFDKINVRIDEMDEKIDKEVLDINSEITTVHTQLNNAMLEVKNEMDFELRILNEKITELKNINNNGKMFELTVSGIPVIDCENLGSTIAKISSVLKFEDDKSIVNVHRLISKHQTSQSPITNTNVIICFNTIKSRRLFLSKYFAFIKMDPLKLNHIGIDGQNRIFINENVSKQCLDLLKKAKVMKKDGKIAGAYTYNGQVYVVHHKNDNKPVMISSCDDLSKYS